MPPQEQTLTFGAIARGEDPRPRAIGITTFEDAARAWHAHGTEGWSPVQAGDVIDALERNVFPAIGAATLDLITRPVMLQLLERVEARGAKRP